MTESTFELLDILGELWNSIVFESGTVMHALIPTSSTVTPGYYDITIIHYRMDATPRVKTNCLICSRLMGRSGSTCIDYGVETTDDIDGFKRRAVEHWLEHGRASDR